MKLEYDRILKEMEAIKAGSDALSGQNAVVQREGAALLAKVKANNSRLDAARAAVQIGQATGGVGQGAFEALRAAQREQANLRRQVQIWERMKAVVDNSARELADRNARLRRRIEVYNEAVRHK